jgi:hypothetical protein
VPLGKNGKGGCQHDRKDQCAHTFLHDHGRSKRQTMPRAGPRSGFLHWNVQDQFTTKRSQCDTPFK